MIRSFNRHGIYVPRWKAAWWIGGLVLTALVVVGIIVASKLLERDRMLDIAEESLASGKAQDAAIYLKAAYDADPEDLRTLRLLVDLFEQAAHPSVQHWDRKLLMQVPQSIPDRLRAARHAMQFGEPESALELLAELPAAGAEASELNLLKAAAAGAAGRPADEIRQHLAAAARIRPGNAFDALNLAVLDAFAAPPGSGARRAALLEIERLAEAENAAAPWAALMHVRLGATDPERLQRLAALVDGDTHLRFSLPALDVVYAAGGEPWQAMLAEVRAHADGRRAADPTFWVMDWMNRHGMQAEVIAWAGSSASAKVREFPASLAVAEAYAGSRNWPALRDFLAGQSWPGIDSLRLAMEAVALGEIAERHGQRHIAAMSQKQAIERAARSPSTLRLLEFAARKHGWDGLHEEVLWKIATARNSSPQSALSACARLKRRYLATGELEKSVRVAQRSVELMPSDFIETNNLIYTKLLTGEDTAAHLDQARRLHQAYPEIRPITSTCALAHHFAGDHQRASELMAELPDAFRQHPAIAPFYGIILAHAGEIEPARTYLDRPATLHFEAEEKLVAAARELVDR